MPTDAPLLLGVGLQRRLRSPQVGLGLGHRAQHRIHRGAQRPAWPRFLERLGALERPLVPAALVLAAAARGGGVLLGTAVSPLELGMAALRLVLVGDVLDPQPALRDLPRPRERGVQGAARRWRRGGGRGGRWARGGDRRGWVEGRGGGGRSGAEGEQRASLDCEKPTRSCSRSKIV